MPVAIEYYYYFPQNIIMGTRQKGGDAYNFLNTVTFIIIIFIAYKNNTLILVYLNNAIGRVGVPKFGTEQAVANILDTAKQDYVIFTLLGIPHKADAEKQDQRDQSSQFSIKRIVIWDR